MGISLVGVGEGGRQSQFDMQCRRKPSYVLFYNFRFKSISFDTLNVSKDSIQTRFETERDGTSTDLFPRTMIQIEHKGDVF